MPGRTTKEESSQDANMEDAPPSAQPEVAEDANMEGEEEEEEETEPQRVRIVCDETYLQGRYGIC